jgi:hypothetical protein
MYLSFLAQYALTHLMQVAEFCSVETARNVEGLRYQVLCELVVQEVRVNDGFHATIRVGGFIRKSWLYCVHIHSVESQGMCIHHAI